jgi:shikimate 5-dehydrogenase
MIKLGLIGYPVSHSLSPKFKVPRSRLVDWKATIPYFPFTLKISRD